jgi:uncharacterized protein (TIGR03067 family)
MRRFLSILVTFIVMPVLAHAGGDAAAKKELNDLAGKWKVVGATEGGQELPKGKLPFGTMDIRANGKTRSRLPGGKTEGVLSLDLAKQPKTLDITHGKGVYQDKKQYAIYKVEGKKLMINAAPPGGKEEDRPRSFDTGRTLIFERIKDKSR